ncbi:MAG: fasciclin domain-containing protein [Bacteroidaceae bacterium]|nr:fasciclin domain-containing protein [Bacteroidaceae bacterium]MBR5149015.1 fasciclin domain-containing protein [Bacteroidaceae bacterium]
MRKKHDIIRRTLGIVAMGILGACADPIDDGARYTFTGDTVASYLEKHEDTFSSFIEVAKRGGRFSVLAAYGQYTCFAPTNDAFERFLFVEDSLYRATGKFRGIDSPHLADLSDSMCIVLSQTHILPDAYLTTDMYEGVIPTLNFNDRYLVVSFGVDENNYSTISINNSIISSSDNEVENGVVHIVNSVVNPSSNMLPQQIENHPYLSIFYSALKETGLEDSLQLYKDYSYTDGDKLIQRYDGSGYCNYPANRYYKYTAFVETDDTYREYGIENLDDLKAYAEKWYGTEDQDNPKSRHNALNKFVSYHLLDREVAYNRLVCYNIKNDYYNSEVNFKKNADRYEYYESMLQYSLFKTIKKLSSEEHSPYLYLNFSDRDMVNPEMSNHLNIKILSTSEVKDLGEIYAEFTPNALNGTIHIIDKIMIYNEDEMAGNVMNERLRFDVSSLMSELTNNGIRLCPRGAAGNTGGSEFFIPTNYCKYYKSYNEESRLYYLTANTGWCDYQGDEFIAIGSYDFAYRIPPVPEGTYEIRLAYTGWPTRGIAQFYFDGEVTGIPVDLRYKGNDTGSPVGWVKDSKTDDNGKANDKAMRNRGYMKGPSIYTYGGNLAARDYEGALRKIITTKYLTKGDHWIRIKNVMEDDNGYYQFMHDYIEIVPMTVIRNEEGEDRL